jgi:hypothetical protein
MDGWMDGFVCVCVGVGWVMQDLDFVSVMVQTLNLILLTSSELFELRSLLKQSLVTDQGRDLFISLYAIFFLPLFCQDNARRRHGQRGRHDGVFVLLLLCFFCC